MGSTYRTVRGISVRRGREAERTDLVAESFGHLVAGVFGRGFEVDDARFERRGERKSCRAMLASAGRERRGRTGSVREAVGVAHVVDIRAVLQLRPRDQPCAGEGRRGRRTFNHLTSPSPPLSTLSIQIGHAPALSSNFPLTNLAAYRLNGSHDLFHCAPSPRGSSRNGISSSAFGGRAEVEARAAAERGTWRWT